MRKVERGVCAGSDLCAVGPGTGGTRTELGTPTTNATIRNRVTDRDPAARAARGPAALKSRRSVVTSTGALYDYGWADSQLSSWTMMVLIRWSYGSSLDTYLNVCDGHIYQRTLETTIKLVFECFACYACM